MIKRPHFTKYHFKFAKIHFLQIIPNWLESYTCISGAYKKLGQYTKALLFVQQAHEIHENRLPPNHPNLATSFNNIGAVYNDLGEYLKVLLLHEKALAIEQKTLSPDHSAIAYSYKNGSDE
jgi:tetratricopeptide (TPR) repeat protein